MEVSDLKQYLPKEFEGGYKNNRRYIHAVICVYLLTVIQPEYKKITYGEFIDNFEEYVEITGSSDNPCLFYQSGKHQGELKTPNKSTFSNNWIYDYDVPTLLNEFKTDAAKHIAKTAMTDVILSIPNFIEKETETFNKADKKQKRLLNNLSDEGKQPYQIKAYQETKGSALTNINGVVEWASDYTDTLNQQNSQGEVYNPNHDRIIDKYHNLENEWEED